MTALNVPVESVTDTTELRWPWIAVLHRHNQSALRTRNAELQGPRCVLDGVGHELAGEKCCGIRQLFFDVQLTARSTDNASRIRRRHCRLSELRFLLVTHSGEPRFLLNGSPPLASGVYPTGARPPSG